GGAPPGGADEKREGKSAAAAEIAGRTVGGEPRAVGGDQRVGGEQVAVLGADLAQAGRADLLAHLEQPFGVEAEPAALLEHRGERRDVDRVLALVVGGAAAVVAAVSLDELPGREAGLPAGVEPADHVAVAVDQHGPQAGTLDALAEQERPARLGV